MFTLLNILSLISGITLLVFGISGRNSFWPLVVAIVGFLVGIIGYTMAENFLKAEQTKQHPRSTKRIKDDNKYVTRQAFYWVGYVAVILAFLITWLSGPSTPTP